MGQISLEYVSDCGGYSRTVGCTEAILVVTESPTQLH